MGQQMPQSGASGMNDMRAVLGVRDDASAVNAEQMRRQQMQSVSMQVQDIGTRLDGIARQFPASARSIEEMKRALTKLLVEIVGSSMSESQAPTGDLG